MKYFGVWFLVGLFGLSLAVETDLWSTQEVIEAFVFSDTLVGTVIQQVRLTPQIIDGSTVNPRFSLKTVNEYFQVMPASGRIIVRRDLRSMFTDTEEYKIETMEIEVFLTNSKIRMPILAVIRVQKSVDCIKYTKNFCFNMVEDKTRIFYNQETLDKPIVLTSNLVSASHKHSCRHLEISYTLTQEKSTVYFRSRKTPSNEAVIYSREETSKRNVSEFHSAIRCFVNDTATGTVSNYSMTFVVRLRERRRAPRDVSSDMNLQMMHRYDVYLNYRGLEANRQLQFNPQIILTYHDSTSNPSDFKISAESVGEIDMAKMFKLNRKVFPKNGATILYIDPLPLVTRNISEELSFRIIVKHLKAKPTSQTDVIHVFLHPGIQPHRLTTQNPAAIPTDAVFNFTVSRSVCDYRHVAKPFDALQKSGVIGKDVEFFVENGAGFFEVTKKEGILYVKEPRKLWESEENHYEFQIGWRSGGAENGTVVHVFVEESETGTGSADSTCSRKEICAEKRTPADCQYFRNVYGTDGGCYWLSGSELVNGANRTYATCTTNQRTCPDGRCDELEMEHWGLCPQDCTAIVLLGRLGPGERGVSGRGVCSCDNIKTCSCGPDGYSGISTPLIIREKKNKNFTTSPPIFTSESLMLNDEERPDDPCGPTCYALIAMTVVAFIGVICGTAATVITRHKKMMKGKTRHLGSTISLSAVPSDYVDERERAPLTDQLVTSVIPHQLGYDALVEPKWMVPRECLVLEKTLGEGEFGKVMKARALNINGSQGLTTVAVKMAKVGGGEESDTAIQDLWSEFSLLKEVDHIHVIRLIGACFTNNELMLILEYAEHGSLRSYLRRSRKIEIDENAGDRTEPDDFSVSPRDILSFAWQISKGMAYLSEMKLVHRDLAARNILVASGKLAKISDFGLTRDVYEEDAYLKRSKGRVPVKWMAPESLADQLYTSKSDVWSFGILLWELTTLGSTPYPGVRPEQLYRMLKSGYRMERPDNCSQELYSIMLHCWEESPGDRPTFQELVSVFDRMLADGAEYLDLTSLLVNNPGYIGGCESDEGDDKSTEDIVERPHSTEEQETGEADVVYLIPKTYETGKVLKDEESV